MQAQKSVIPSDYSALVKAMGKEEIKVEPSVLRWARESSGLSLAAAAHMLHRPQGSLQSLEEGSSNPSLPLLRQMARVYRRPLVALLLSHPRAETLPTDFRVSVHKAPLSRPTRLALRRAKRLQLIANEMGAWDFRLATLSSSSFEPEQVEALAESIREHLNVSLSDQRQWTHLYDAFGTWRRAIEGQGVLVFQMQMPLDELRAFSYPHPDPPVIALNTADYIGSRIFSMLHELGHLLLGEGGLCDPDTGRFSEAAVGIEAFCNRFAGAVLVPRAALEEAGDVLARLLSQEIPSDSSFNALTGALRVSRPVILYRLRQLGFLDARVFETKWLEWTAQWRRIKRTSRGPALTRAARRLNERGESFVGRVVRAAETGDIPESTALDYLDLQKGDLGDVRALLTS